jgi:hypothetical protein
VRLKGPYLFYLLFLLLIYLYSATWGGGDDLCFLFILSQVPPFCAYRFDIFLFYEYEILGFIILRKINVGFSFENVTVFALVKPVSSYFPVSIVE